MWLSWTHSRQKAKQKGILSSSISAFHATILVWYNERCHVCSLEFFPRPVCSCSIAKQSRDIQGHSKSIQLPITEYNRTPQLHLLNDTRLWRVKSHPDKGHASRISEVFWQMPPRLSKSKVFFRTAPSSPPCLLSLWICGKRKNSSRVRTIGWISYLTFHHPPHPRFWFLRTV